MHSEGSSSAINIAIDEEPITSSTKHGLSYTSAKKSGFDPKTRIYRSLAHIEEQGHEIPTRPDLDVATFVLSQFPSSAEADRKLALIDSATDQRVTYAELRRSILLLAAGLYHGLGIRKGDVVIILSPNSLLYPVACFAVLYLGAVVTTANPLNTREEIAKQVKDSGATLAICSPQETHKLSSTKIPTLLTHRSEERASELSVEDLLENCDPLEIPEPKPTQSDTAAILYSSGTTGTSKGVVLTHANLISVITLLKWSVEVSDASSDVYLCFIPLFHVYGLVFFGLGLFCCGVTIVLMRRFKLKSMLEAVERYRVNNIPAVPPVILGLVKSGERAHDLSSLKRVGSGAAPLSKDLVEAFRRKYPWVELRPGYGLTEASGAGTFFASREEAEARPGSIGRLSPCFEAKVVDVESGFALPPCKEGELWLKGPTVMKEYLKNGEATEATLDGEGWLKTGDLCYFDEDGYVYVVDRIKELIKHNGFQVAPAELEAVLMGHPQILDAAVVPLEDEATGQVPIAYVVRTADSKLTEDDIIRFVARQVSPYKKIRRVSFIRSIPRSAAGKILRRELVSLCNNKEELILSKL